MRPVVKAFKTPPPGRATAGVELLNTDALPPQTFTLLYMSPATARRLGNALIEAACWVEEPSENERTFKVEVTD